ncbi:MAG: cyclic nucleotide-binding domain-containing protein [Mariprofundaceae bacterium]|nr:cyclic nucleotide-binding domain-containing protein [Mariprofundaceae bacterium]
MSEDFLDISGMHIDSGKAPMLDEIRFPILDGLSAVNMRILNTSSREMHVAKGVEVLHEGSASYDMHFIRKGSVSITRRTSKGLKILAQIRAGGLYGEFGILRKKFRYTSVFANEPSDIIRTSASSVQRVIEGDAAFRDRLNTLLSNRLLDSFFFTHPVFQPLPAHLRDLLSGALKIHYSPPFTQIFSRGDKPTGVHLILSGEVELSLPGRNNEDTLLEIRRDNDMVGELANRDGSLAYSAYATEALDSLWLNQETMRLIEEASPTIYKNLQKLINARAQRTAQHLKQQLLKS